MAEKRMFAKSIVLTDAFLDMPMSARCLYFTLGMLADDDGFVGSPKSILRQCGASQDDLAILMTKRFVLGFASGVIVIKHWRINNYLQNDRHHPTTYQEELATLMLDQKGSYMECIQPVSNMDTTCIQDVYADKNSIDKNRLDKVSIEEREEAGKPPRSQAFKPPTVEEVAAYCAERNNGIDPQAFIGYYASANWFRGKTKIKDWKACVRTWEQRDKESPPKPQQKRRSYTTAEEYKPSKEIDTAKLDKLAKLIHYDN